MRQRLAKARHWAGLDRSVLFIIAGRAWGLVSGPVTILLVARYFTPDLQGYYYTFGSVLALQIFLEMGFSQCIIQYASHEFARLRFGPSGRLEGEADAKSRLISLGRLAAKWYAILALLVILGLGTGGQLFFSSKGPFASSDFRDGARLIQRLRDPADPVGQSIWERFSAEARRALLAPATTPQEQNELLAKQLNRIVRSDALYETGRFAGVPLSAATLELAKQHPSGAARVRLNRLLLEDTFPDELARSFGAHWRGPWWCLCVMAGINLALLPFWSLVEGCNRVAFVYGLRALLAVAASVGVWLALALGTGLYCGAISLLVVVGVTTAVFGWVWRGLLADLRQPAPGPTISWGEEIWPYQWRIAVSGMCGYFIFNLFTPVLFYFHSPALAGQMGMTWQLVNSLHTVAASWSTSKAPRYGILISQGRFAELDQLYKKTTVQALAAAVAGGVVLLLALAWVRSHFTIGARFLPVGPTALLVLATVVNQLVFSQAAYLRAHKKEPFLGLSVLSALLTGAAVLFLGRAWGAWGESVGYCVIALALVPLATWIWKTRRREWHPPPEGLPSATK